LDKINKARNSTYELIAYHNVDPTIVHQNISKIIEIFTQTTNKFENNPCLKFKEEEIDRYGTKNCYSHICGRILENFGNYEITIGETAYYGTNYYYIVGYEFYLGPLYFEVRQTEF
jgi:hypothetical protein